MPEVTTPSRRLFALLVGINKYQSVRALYGCERDVGAVRAYLAQPFVREQFASVDVLPLISERATKEAIVKHFQEHLGKAGPGDVAFFYFSGHGVREETNIPAFRQSELDAKIGNIVCVDSSPRGDGVNNTCLADKELRWLIHQLEQKGPRIITIFDCCHSGDNTRSVLEEEFPSNFRQIERRAIKARDWKGFIFHDQPKITLESLTNLTLDQVIPQGRHIQMAACRDVELAREEPADSLNRNGVFTTALLDVLTRYQGRVSYNELHNRIVNSVRQQDVKAQTPQIYYCTPDSTDRFRMFLTDELDDRPNYCAVIFNQHKQEWRISLGAIHAVPYDTEKHPTEVTVYPVDEPKKTVKAMVSKVFPGYSVIRLPDDFKPDLQKTYRAFVRGLAIQPVKLFLSGEKAATDMAGEELVKLGKDAETQYFDLVKAESDADFVLRADGKTGGFLTTLPHDQRPIIMPISYKSETGDLLPNKVELAYTDFRQIARWAFLRDLNYKALPDPPPGLPPMYPVELRLYQVIRNEQGQDVEKAVDLSNGVCSMDLTHNLATDSPYTKIRLELINHSEQELFCTLLYQSARFGVSSVIPNDAAWLGPNQTVQSLFHPDYRPYIPVSLDYYVRKDNWQGIREYLKLMVSSTPFEIKDLTMEDIPAPYESTTRSWSFQQAAPGRPQVEWDVKTFEMFTANPFYDPNR